MAFEILQIPRTDDGVRSYVARYKAFRLLALQTAPEAFGSTYAREIAFTDDVWDGRLTNPKAATFVALKDDCILSTLTAIGPLPSSPEESFASRNPWISSSKEFEEAAALHYQINGTFTLPEARGQGIAKALMRATMKHVMEEAATAGKISNVSILVDSENVAARSLYVKEGFVPVKEEMLSPGRPVVLLEYVPNTLDLKSQPKAVINGSPDQKIS